MANTVRRIDWSLYYLTYLSDMLMYYNEYCSDELVECFKTSLFEFHTVQQCSGLIGSPNGIYSNPIVLSMILDRLLPSVIWCFFMKYHEARNGNLDYPISAVAREIA
jgi:hypothetical protein